MGRVLESNASEAFGEFVVRRIALTDLAPAADDAVLDGIEESPDGGAAIAEAHLAGLPYQEREELLERAALESVEVTPEMVAVAAITELGDSSQRAIS